MLENEEILYIQVLCNLFLCVFFYIPLSTFCTQSFEREKIGITYQVYPYWILFIFKHVMNINNSENKAKNFKHISSDPLKYFRDV